MSGCEISEVVNKISLHESMSTYAYMRIEKMPLFGRVMVRPKGGKGTWEGIPNQLPSCDYYVIPLVKIDDLIHKQEDAAVTVTDSAGTEADSTDVDPASGEPVEVEILG